MRFQHFCKLLLILTAVSTVSCEKQYKGYKVFSIPNLANDSQYNAVVSLHRTAKSVDFWTDPSRKRPTNLMVSPEDQENVSNYLKKAGIQYSVTIPDVQRVVEKEKSTRENRQEESQSMNWREYQRLKVIHDWMDAIARHNPTVASISSIGRSTEGRDLKMLKISANPGKNNPVFYIDGGIHAREWISPAVVTYIIGKLMSYDPEDKDILANVDYYFVPVLNPDGYEFTHTEDRLWRKSRSRHNGADCIGVDLNRNFDFHWGEAGVKDDPCGNTYHGPTPFSEPEANATSKFMLNNRNRIRAYITFHSYSQLMLTPYGYTEELPDDYDQLETVGKRAMKALEDVHGTEYEVGAPSHILYSNSGSSRDWAKGVPGIKYSYTIELRDQGEVGFLLPPNEILPTCEETWEAVKVVARQVAQEGYKVYRVKATNTAIFEVLKNVYHQEQFDFWSPPSTVTPTDILVPPQQVSSLHSLLTLIGADFEVLKENIQLEMDYEQLNYIARNDRAAMSWNAYHRLDTIHSWMESMAQQYPSLVSVFTIGNSTEGRPLKVMKISTGGANSQKPAVWIDGGIHAREWISPATTSFIANELITQATRKRQTKYIQAFDWYINPVMNPDGYEYTHQYDRLWRKTRSGGKPIFGGLFGCCKGTDPNRNWNHQWGGKGTSKNQCSQIYHGPSPASEPEVHSVQSFIMERKDQIKLFLTFHSYSQLLLLPWGYDKIRTEDHDELMRVGDKALKALEAVHGTKYEGGATPELLYPAAGGSHDWAKGEAGIKYSYCYELRDTGRHGFILPANQIKPTGEETFAAVKSMADDVMEYYNISIPAEGSRLFETYNGEETEIEKEVTFANYNQTCTKADEENCVIRYGERKCDCRTSFDTCFLPNVPKGRCTKFEGGINCCSRQTCNKCCCCKEPVCECVQLINCRRPNKPYGFCEGSINVKCCNVPPETQCAL